MTRSKKIAKPSQPKLTTPTTRASTCFTALKAKEKTKPTEKGGEVQKKPMRKYIAQDESDEERTKLDDNSQFQVVSHNPSSELENLCENIKNSVDLTRFSHIDFDNLGKVENNQVEEAIYATMTNFKKAPIEIANPMPKSLYERVEQK